MGTEVIHPRFQTLQVATDQVQIDVIERPGAGGRAKEDLPARIFPAPGNAGGEKKHFRQRFQLGNRVNISLAAAGRDGCKRSQPRRGEMLRQRQRLELGIDFKGDRLGFPVEVMRVAVDALVGVLGPVMISPCGLKVAVFHGLSLRNS